jgi:flavin-dependent dehydrogenase
MAMPISSTRREIFGEGFILIEDAAGLAYPYSGEGIRTAVESALLAADTIIWPRGIFAERSLRHTSSDFFADLVSQSRSLNSKV